MCDVKGLKTLLIVLGAVIVAIGVTLTAAYVSGQRELAEQQTPLDPFYEPPAELPQSTALGTILKIEPLPAAAVTNASPYRIMYVTEGVDGAKKPSTGMVFIPKAPPPAGGRKIVAWAHATVGMGSQCAPSRRPNPIASTPWVQTMLDRGWIVTSTDYAGLGMPGLEYYLIGRSEAMDVVNSVRAAQKVPGSDSSKTYAVYGHSQGGHAALWTGAVSPKYAPELNLVGTAAAAPASELTALTDQSWNQPVGWVIGPEVLKSFPAVYPELSVTDVTSEVGLQTYEDVSEKCIASAGVIGLVRTEFGQNLFSSNPTKTNPQWAAAFEAETAPALPKSMPAMVIESVSDGVVLPNTIALQQEKWCAAGSNLTVNWLGPLNNSGFDSHQLEGPVGGEIAATWIYQRFAGIPAEPNCNVPPPVAPYVATK